MSKKKYDDDALDLLIDKIARASLICVDEVKAIDNCTQSEKIEYLCRAFTEILGVLIVSAPKNEVHVIVNNIVSWIQACAARNIALSDMMGNVDNKNVSIKETFEDFIFYTNKKGEA